MIKNIFIAPLTQEDIYLLAMLIPLLLQLGGMVFAALIDSYIEKKHKQILLIVALLVFSLIIQNILEDMLAAGELNWLFRTITSIYGYAVRPVILLLFLYIVSPERKHMWAWILCVVNALVNLTALFTDICFEISSSNHFQRGPLSDFCLYVSMILLAYLIYLTIREYIHIKKREIFIPMLIVLLIVGAIILDGQVGTLQQPVTFLTIAIVSSCVFFYIWLHLQFAREHEKDMEEQQRMRMMMTQIQPHFLYNTIATFKALCRKDPEKAAELAGNFGRYLRQNMNSLDTTGCIPFERELEHTKIYTDIEMVRFENIKVEYDIEDDDFMIPPLSMQPIVENAIRHGVRIRDEGIVKVSTRKKDYYHEILIEDNGIGFDTLKENGGEHIGIDNVKNRIESMCNGTFIIESEIDRGTKVIICIPGSFKEDI